MFYYKQNLKNIDKDTNKILYLLFKYSYKYYNKLLYAKVNNKHAKKDKLDIYLGNFLCKSIAGNLNINYSNFIKSNGDFKKPEFRFKEKEFFIAFFGKNFKIENGFVILYLNKKSISFKITDNMFKMINNIKDIRMVRLHKTAVKNDYYIVFEYNKQVNNSFSGNLQNGYGFKAGIDLGMDNLITVYSNNTSSKPLIIRGKYIKYINYKYINIIKNLDVKKDNYKINMLYKKRQNTIKYFFNKALKKVFDYLKYYNVKEIFIGDFNGVKTKNLNSNFYNISYFVLNKKFKDYAKKNNIIINFIKEDFTSKTSFLDFEKPEIKTKYVGNREKRGLFVTKHGYKINADINGAAQILCKKVFVKDRNNILKKPFIFNLIIKKPGK